MARVGSLALGLAGWVFLLVCGPDAEAQRIATKNAPRPAESVPVLTGVFPPGTTIGTTTEWTIRGRNLADVERLRISGRGVEVAELKSRTAESVVAIVRTAPDAESGFRELRAEAPDGISNLLVIRVDRWAQVAESEPNDDPGKADELDAGKAAVGILAPQDLDHFRIRGRRGQKVVVDVEAQRLGAPISPVVTILSAAGAALAQGHRGRGSEHDCRLSYTLPEDGSYVIQLRDNVYGGDASACYRLRVDDAPFATGLFPLGGPRGRTITVTASGGNLSGPRTKKVTLPDEPGAVVEAGPFDGPGGPVLAPARLVVGEGPEIDEEAPGPSGASTTVLSLGATANGRLDRPDEVDRYAIAVKKDERIRLRVRASSLGSWLDSVLTLRDGAGKVLAENDDVGNPGQRNGGFFGIPDTAADSVLDYTPTADGTLYAEVSDRYGEGGPEYAYRLAAGPTSPDFTIALLLGNPQTNRQLAVGGRRVVAGGPGSNGAFNVRPGATIPINFLVTPEGRPGAVVVSAEGLPEGVTVDPVTVRLPSPPRTGRASGPVNSPPAGGSLVLRVAPNAAPAVGELRVVATAKRPDGTTLRRLATASLSIDVTGGGAGVRGQAAVPLRLVTSLPLKVIGTPRPAPSGRAARPAGPGGRVSLKGVTVPGVLLQGGRIELLLALDPADARPQTYRIVAEAKGRGLAISGPMTPSVDSPDTAVALRVQAAVDAPPGVSTIAIHLASEGGGSSPLEVPLIVRAPIRVSAHPDPVSLGVGGSAAVWVGVERESGYAGPVELRVAGLPEGVRAPGRFVVPAGETGGLVRLVREGGGARVVPPTAVRVVGVARMPRGPVSVDSPIRPMVSVRPAEK